MRLARLVALDRLHQQSNVSSMNFTPSTSSSGRAHQDGVIMMTIIQGYFEGIAETIVQTRSFGREVISEAQRSNDESTEDNLISSQRGQRALCRDTAAFTGHFTAKQS